MEAFGWRENASCGYLKGSGLILPSTNLIKVDSAVSEQRYQTVKNNDVFLAIILNNYLIL